MLYVHIFGNCILARLRGKIWLLAFAQTPKCIINGKLLKRKVLFFNLEKTTKTSREKIEAKEMKIPFTKLVPFFPTEADPNQYYCVYCSGIGVM